MKKLKSDYIQEKDPTVLEEEALEKHVRRITECNFRRQGRDLKDHHELPVVTCKASKSKILKKRTIFSEEDEEKLTRFT